MKPVFNLSVTFVVFLHIVLVRGELNVINSDLSEQNEQSFGTNCVSPETISGAIESSEGRIQSSGTANEKVSVVKRPHSDDISATVTGIRIEQHKDDAGKLAAASSTSSTICTMQTYQKHNDEHDNVHDDIDNVDTDSSVATLLATSPSNRHNRHKNFNSPNTITTFVRSVLKMDENDWRKRPVAVAFDKVEIGSAGIGIDGSSMVVSATGPPDALASIGTKKLHFPACPDGEIILVEKQLLHKHHLLPFAIFSMLLGMLQPLQFPLETFYEAVQGQLAFHVLLLQVIKVEILLVVWIVFWLIMAGYVPYSSIGEICCRRRKFLQRLENHSSASSLEHHEHGKRRQRCTESCSTFALHTLLLLLMLSIGLMLTGNEQANRSVAGLINRANIVFEDTERFVRNSEMQISFVTATSLEIAFDAIENDLEESNELLGEPIKETLRDFYNLDKVFLSLNLIEQDSIEISKTVEAINEDCKASQSVGDKLQARLEDLIPLVRNIHQVCAERDGPLCETLSISGFDVTFNVKELTVDAKLKYLHGITSRSDFNSSLHEAEINYENIARRVALETEHQRAVISIVLFFEWFFLLCGTPCCCTRGTKTSYTIIGVVIASTASIFVWLLGSGALLLGAHGENFVCRPFYDPLYKTFASLADDGGWLVPSGGLLKQRLNLNESVRIVDALRAMENNKTVYKTFNLKALLDIETLTDYKNWQDLEDAFGELKVQRDLKILTPSLENSLLDFTNAGSINLTTYRTKLSRPTTAKDLNAFLDQIYATSKHISDGRTKGRLENLTFKLRDIVNGEYKTLNDVQDRLIYHITALDVMLKPLVKKAEHVLGNLTKFQHSMNVELETITKNHVVNYTSRLKDYLAQFRANVLYEIKHRTAKTGPLWNIFTTIRVTLCDGCVDGINALSFSCYLSILLMVSLQPVLWHVIKHFRESNEENLSTILRRSVSEELIHQNPRNWHIPHTGQRVGSPDTIAGDVEESVWVSPRQTHEVYVPPPPPRQPSETTIAIEQYASTTPSYSPNPIGFEQTNRATERVATPMLSATRRWI